MKFGLTLDYTAVPSLCCYDLSLSLPYPFFNIQTLFAKLAKYVGPNLVHLIDRPSDPYCFRLRESQLLFLVTYQADREVLTSPFRVILSHTDRDRVYYVSEAIMKQATSIARPNLSWLGTCLGKFSKTRKFRLHITALEWLAKYAKYKVSHTNHRY